MRSMLVYRIMLLLKQHPIKIKTMTQQISADFSNNTINKSAIPTIEKQSFQALSAKYAPTHRMVNLVTTLCIVILLAGLLHQPWIELNDTFAAVLEVILWVVGVIGLTVTLYNSVADPKKLYLLREQDISYQHGLIFRKTISQPIMRVQHVELKRGPIDRKVGLANLQLFSAGGALHTFEIPGLEYDDAENMRQFILAHKDINQHG